VLTSGGARSAEQVEMLMGSFPMGSSRGGRAAPKKDGLPGAAVGDPGMPGAPERPLPPRVR